jgi:hypothetical protein
MKRRAFVTIASVAVLGLALLPTNLSSQQGSLKDQLIGTWTVVSW